MKVHIKKKKEKKKHIVNGLSIINWAPKVFGPIREKKENEIIRYIQCIKALFLFFIFIFEKVLKAFNFNECIMMPLEIWMKWDTLLRQSRPCNELRDRLKK